MKNNSPTDTLYKYIIFYITKRPVQHFNQKKNPVYKSLPTKMIEMIKYDFNINQK